MTRQYATFYVNERLYGVEVTKVQEVTRELPLTLVPLAPPYVRGLINLRGQIAPAVELRTLIDHAAEGRETGHMTVVCQIDDGLLSLLVDRVGDVVEVSDDIFEPVPNNLEGRVRELLTGVYKLDEQLLSIIEINKLTAFLNHEENTNAGSN